MMGRHFAQLPRVSLSAMGIALANLFIVLSIGLAVLLTGCGDDETGTCPDPVGVITGFVGDGEGPLVANVVARRVVPAGFGEEFFAVSDSAGNYVLRVTPGEYTLLISERVTGIVTDVYRLCYTTDGPACDSFDTLSVTGGEVRADFLCSSATAILEMPGWDDGSIYMSIYRPDLYPPQGGQGAVSGGVGQVTVRMLPPGPCNFRLRAGAASIWLPNSYELSNAGAYELVGGQTTQIESELTAPAGIDGRILGSWQTFGERPPYLTAFSDDSLAISSVTCDPEGYFSLRLPIPIRVRLQVSIGGVDRWLGGEDFWTAEPFAPRAGETLTLDPDVESGIRCTLRAPDDIVESRVYVKLVDAHGIRAQTSTIGNSVVEIPNLYPGTYYLYVESPRGNPLLLPQWYDGSADSADATPIEVLPDGAITDVVMTLVAGGSIEGRFLPCHATLPWPHWRLELYAQSDSMRVVAGSWSGFDTGGFKINGVPDGSYYLGAQMGEGYWWFPGTHYLHEAAEIVITGHQRVTGIEWCLPN